jgi:hypothetical protein
MSGLEVVVVALVAVWLAVLTIVVLLLVRQIGLLTVRLEHAGPRISMDDDGLDVGRPVPEQTLAAVPELAAGRKYAVVLSASCAPCRDLAAELGRAQLDADVIVLVAGDEEFSPQLVALLDGLDVVLDPRATEATAGLEIGTAPFAFELTDGVVTAKTYLRSVAELAALTEAVPESASAGANGGRISVSA